MTDKLRKVSQQAPMAYYALVIKADSGYESTTEGRCTADQYGAAMAALHGTAALAQQDAQAVPQGEAIVEEFSAWLNERRGMSVAWVFHDVVAKFRAMLNAAPTPPAQQDAQGVPQPIGYARPFDLEALQNPANPTVSLVVARDAFGFCTAPIYAAPTPPAQRVELTDEEIERIYTEETGSFIDDSPWALKDFARAIIEAYERKNGAETTPPAQHREPDYTICPTCGGMASDPIVPQEQISDGEFDADKRLMELADKIDHEQNWRLSGIDQRDRLTQEQQDRVTAGVMLRRYADLMAPDSWRLFPPKRLGAVITSFRASTLEKAVAMAMKYQGLNGAIEANLKERNA